MDIQETLDMTLEKLKKLGDENNEQIPSLEKYVEGEICALLDAESSIGKNLINITDVAIEADVEQSGSIVEGATMARIFQNKEDWKEVEMDLMFNKFTIPQEASGLLEAVENKPGFVRIPFSKEVCCDYYTVYAEEYLEEENMLDSLEQKPRYISPQLIKEGAKAAAEDNPSSFLTNNPYYNSSASKTETTMELNFHLSSLRVSIDIVPAVNLDFWPHQAAPWITRCRRWPPQDIIKSIVEKGCQVVPRSSPGGDESTEWRLSFSRPEARLAQLRTEKQKQVYYFFKLVFYQYLKGVESSDPKGKPLYSYIIKTTMLWASEELPPEDPIWASLEKSAKMLLSKLLGSLQKRFLAHYFIPEINLLERVGEDVRNQCMVFISRWQSNILMTAPFDLPEKREFIHFVHHRWARTFARFTNKDFMSDLASFANQLGDDEFASAFEPWAQK